MDTARKGRIEPKFEYLSRGDPLDRAEKSRDRTTLFRGQKVKKGRARPPNRYRLNEKRDVPRTETKGRTASKLGMRRRRGPLIRAPEFEGRGGFFSILCAAARLAKIRPVSGSLLLNSMADKETYEK